MDAQVETTFRHRGGLHLGQLRRFVVVGCSLVLAGTIAPLLMLPAQASDLNRQLTVPLNNGTRGNARDRADRLLQYGKTLEMDGILVGAIQAGTGGRTFPAAAVGAYPWSTRLYRTGLRTQSPGQNSDAKRRH